MVARQEVPVSEVALARCLHRAVGGPAALSAIDNPTAAREAVLAALAAQQTDPSAARRVASGELTPLERRVVRTVTNRGAAVRSRVRQRRELTRLREELKRKDDRLLRVETALRALYASASRAHTAPIPPSSEHAPKRNALLSRMQALEENMPPAPEPGVDSQRRLVVAHAGVGLDGYVQDVTYSGSSSEGLGISPSTFGDAPLDPHQFANLIDQLISPKS